MLSSNEQIILAELLGISIVDDTFDVAAARLLDTVATALGYEPLRPSTEKQLAFARSLEIDVANDSLRVANAKIRDALLAKNKAAIAMLDLKPGDQVIRVEQFEFNGMPQTLERKFIVSSIQPNGRVFFKGGNGQGAWPTQLRKPTEIECDRRATG